MTERGPMSTSKQAIEAFSQDLGRLLGAARAKAEDWLGQRKNITEQLLEIRDTASSLLQQLGHTDGELTRGRRAASGRGAGRPTKRGPGRPKGSGRKRRKLSTVARKAISDAQKKRWAKVKASQKS